MRGGGAGAYYTLACFLHCVICVAISFVNRSMLNKTKYIIRHDICHPYIANRSTGVLGVNDLARIKPKTVKGCKIGIDNGSNLGRCCLR